MLQAVHEALQGLKAQLVDKRVLWKPFITDFDKVNCGTHLRSVFLEFNQPTAAVSGHITRQQFHRACSMISLVVPRANVDVLVHYYGSERFPTLFDYRTFLLHLNQDEPKRQFRC